MSKGSFLAAFLFYQTWFFIYTISYTLAPVNYKYATHIT